jgi:hypothetical protein
VIAEQNSNQMRSSITKYLPECICNLLQQQNNPIHVNRGTGQLEGAVAYFGTMEFASGNYWLGIRLMGSLVGLGKNDGTVKDKQYFACPNNCECLFDQQQLQDKYYPD